MPCCYIDVDRLQAINETCGHHAGDELLRQVAATMLAKLRRSDVLARAGGDEFAVLMPNCPLHRARQIAQTLLDTVRDAGFNWQGRTCSVSLERGRGVDRVSSAWMPQGLLAAAEAASTLAKDAGGDRVHVYQGHGTGTPARGGEGDWATRIASGLARDRFHLFAQRVVPIDDPAGPCALLLRDPAAVGRAQRRAAAADGVPARGRALPPDAGGGSLGDRPYPECARAVPARGGAGRRGPSYSLNLSGASLADEGLLDFIVAELERTGVPARRICFEVAEATALSHLHQASVLAKGLKRVGCRFALDHFHSGVGAYAYLQDLPVDYVKIDGSFVKGMLSDQLDCAVVEGISRIGQALGIETVGECTESTAILARLKDLGVSARAGLPDPPARAPGGRAGSAVAAAGPRRRAAPAPIGRWSGIRAEAGRPAVCTRPHCTRHSFVRDDPVSNGETFRPRAARPSQWLNSTRQAANFNQLALAFSQLSAQDSSILQSLDGRARLMLRSRGSAVEAERTNARQGAALEEKRS